MYADITLTPGAVISGCSMIENFSGQKQREQEKRESFSSWKTFNISGTMVLGPFDEKAAMKGAGIVPNAVVEGVI